MDSNEERNIAAKSKRRTHHVMRPTIMSGQIVMDGLSVAK
jgi:hypothetical protein